MKLPAILGFLTGTLIVLWAFLRQHSTAAYKVWPGEEVWHYPDPLDEVQPVDPRVVGYSYPMNLPQKWPGDPMRPDMAHVITNGRHDASVCCDLEVSPVSRTVRPVLGAVTRTFGVDCE